jgi:hypothetical protein
MTLGELLTPAGSNFSEAVSVGTRGEYLPAMDRDMAEAALEEGTE